MDVDLAHIMLPIKNHVNAPIRLFRRPKISESVPNNGCVIVAASRNAVPLQKAWFEFPPSSAVMAGNAAAMITASSAEINAVRFNVKYATQNRPDFPANTFFFRILGVSDWDCSSILISSRKEGELDDMRLDMTTSPVSRSDRTNGLCGRFRLM